MGRAGKRIRVNCYQVNTSGGDIVIRADLLDKDLSKCDKFGRRVWQRVYNGEPGRPKQAVKLFLVWLKDNGYWGSLDSVFSDLEYWAKDMNFTVEQRKQNISLNKG